MSEQNLLRLALWFETIGFALSAVLILFVKWQALKTIFDGLKSFIVKLPTGILKFFEPILWLLTHIATEGGKIPESLEPKRLPVYTIRLVIHVMLVAPILLLLSTALVIPIYIVFLITKLLSGHNAITNLLITLGSFSILAGLIIELVLSY